MEPTRRRFLRNTGLAAGAVWVAPQVVSVPAAAAATVPPAPPFKSFAGAHSVPGGDLTIFTAPPGVDPPDVIVGAAAGDFLLALVAHHIDDGHTYAVTAPPGWTLIGVQDATDTGGQNPGVRTHLYTHVIAPGDTSYTWSIGAVPAASTAWTVVVVDYGPAALSLNPASPPSTGVPTAAATPTSITVGGYVTSPSTTATTTIGFVAPENPLGPWSAPGGYTQQVAYAPNNSVPEIYVADGAFGTTSVAAATFSTANIGHPTAAWLVGVSPFP